MASLFSKLAVVFILIKFFVFFFEVICISLVSTCVQQSLHTVMVNSVIIS